MNSSTPIFNSFLSENRSFEKAQAIYEQRVMDARIVYDNFASGFNERSCPVCGSEKSRSVEKFDDRYGVSVCSVCNTLFVNPAPSVDALNFYYNHCQCNEQLRVFFQQRADTSNPIIDGRITSALDKVLAKGALESKLKVLEIGCNSGAFLAGLHQAAKTQGIDHNLELIGIDIDEKAVNNPASKDITLLHATAEELHELSSETFDFVFHFELIEHLHDPFAFCVASRRLLKPGGTMFFTTPNILGLDNQALNYNSFRPLAHAIFPPMHLNAFSTQNISHFLLRAGFCVEKISTPGIFDVDIVKQFSENTNGKFLSLAAIEDESILALIQHILRETNGSSHMEIEASRT